MISLAFCEEQGPEIEECPACRLVLRLSLLVPVTSIEEG